MLSDRDLANVALEIMQARRWTQARCCELANVASSTWSDSIALARTRSMSRKVRAKVVAFVETYRDLSAPEPPRRRRWKRGPEHHRSKQTPEMVARILSSNAKGVDLAREFGVNSSLITRVRQRGRSDLLQTGT